MSGDNSRDEAWKRIERFFDRFGSAEQKVVKKTPLF